MTRRLIRFIVLASLWTMPGAAAAADDSRVQDAIVRAVRARVGEGAEVVVDSLALFSSAAIAADARIEATPDPAARLGGVVRFMLTVNGARTARAEAVLK